MLARKLLSEEGWWLSDEGYAELGVDRGSSARDARARALDTNLKRLAADGSALGALRDDAVALAGPLVLQLVDVVDVARPPPGASEARLDRDDDDDAAAAFATTSGKPGGGDDGGGGAPRLLRLRLSDGRAQCDALEFRRVDALSATTPPGTKLRVASARVRWLRPNGVSTRSMPAERPTWLRSGGWRAARATASTMSASKLERPSARTRRGTKASNSR